METQLAPAVPISPTRLRVPDVTIILVCWNNKHYLDQCLQSLFEAGPPARFDIIVTDNGSTDGSQAMLREKYPAVRLIQNDRNVGLSQASNQGIQLSDTPYIPLLNNDTLVNRASLEAMVEFLEATPEAGAAGGKLLNSDGSVQFCYCRFPTLLEEFLIATRLGEWLRPGYPATISDDGLRAIDWVSSACLLLRRDALEAVGLLDESYFIYGDEVDLQYRLKRAGWQVYYLPQATTIHFGGRSMDRWRRRKMVYRGKILFFQKNYGPTQTALLRAILLGLSAAKSVVWGLAWLHPRWRERAHREMASNADVIKLCLKPE